MSNNMIQIQKLSSSTLVVDFVVASSRTDRKYEEKNLELIKKKAELEAKKQQENKKHVLAKDEVQQNSKTHNVKQDAKVNKTHLIEKKVVEKNNKNQTKSKIGSKIDSKI